jgi:predicted metal-binding membrane protein
VNVGPDFAHARLDGWIHAAFGAHPDGFWLAFGMWVVMTAVMMVPIVAPWLGALWRLGEPNRDPLGVAAFGTGYAVAWGGFSGLMAAVQTGLVSAGLGAPLAASAPRWAGVALLTTGAFQFTRLKEACLKHCRSPFGYFATSWRPGRRGALSMGLRHGLFCLGCCWALMAVALVVGMTDIRIMALLCALMIMETLTPAGPKVARATGVVLLLLGLGFLTG